jgi:hypothetical protein
MTSEVHAYLTACVGVVVNTTSMEAFTNSILLFWCRNGHKFPTWAAAARIMMPNSASAERVFSLLKAMFGDARASSLADLIEGSLMLKFRQGQARVREGNAGAVCWPKLIRPNLLVMPILHPIYTPPPPQSPAS